MKIQEEIWQLTILNILPVFWAAAVYIFALILYFRDKISDKDNYGRNRESRIGSIYFHRDGVGTLYWGACLILLVGSPLASWNVKHPHYIENMLENVGAISSIVIGLTTLAVTLAVAIILLDKRYYLVFSIREVLQKYGFPKYLIVVIFSCVISCVMAISPLDETVKSFYDFRLMTFEMGVIANIGGITYILGIAGCILFFDQKAELSLLKQLYRRFWFDKIDTSHFKDRKSWSKEAVEINIEYLITQYIDLCQKKKIDQIESIEFIADEKIFTRKWYGKAKSKLVIILVLLWAVSSGINVACIDNKSLITLITLVNAVFVLVAWVLTHLNSESVQTVIMRLYLDTQGYCAYTKDKKEIPIPRVAIRIDNIYDKYIMSMNSLNAFFDIWLNYVDKREKQHIQEMYSKIIKRLECVKNRNVVTYFPVFVIGYFLFDKDIKNADVKDVYRNIVLPQNEHMFKRMLQSQIFYLNQISRDDCDKYMDKIEAYLKWLRKGVKAKKGKKHE